MVRFLGQETDRDVSTSAKESGVENFPMREWSIRLVMLDEAGNEHPADCFNKVVYNLHPSFANPTQCMLWPFHLHLTR
jgi:transcription initiation factor TFIID/TFIIF subunit